jgi:hypothetical protein
VEDLKIELVHSLFSDPEIEQLRSTASRFPGMGTVTESLLVVSTPYSNASELGHSISVVDRELRRVAAVMGRDDNTRFDSDTEEWVLEKSRNFRAVRNEQLHIPFSGSVSEGTGVVGRRRQKTVSPRPTPRSETSLELIEFRPGSAHLVFEIVGTLQQILNSDPVTALATLLSFIDFGSNALHSIRSFVRPGRASREEMLAAVANLHEAGPQLGVEQISLGTLGSETGPMRRRTSSVTTWTGRDGSQTTVTTVAEEFDRP